MGLRVEVRYGRSRSSPVRARRLDPTVDGLDTHWQVVLNKDVFQTAPPEVAQDLASWMKAGRRARRACSRLDAWLDQAVHALPPREPKRIEARGREHDLEQLAAPLLSGEFAESFRAKPAPRITWGRRARSRSRHSLNLGSYAHRENLVRIHSVLDAAWVPEWFVRSILFHELLHAALPIEKDARGHWVHHSPDFRRRERAYPDHARAVVWQEANLGKLIRAARRGPKKGALEVRAASATPPPPEALPAAETGVQQASQQARLPVEPSQQLELF